MIYFIQAGENGPIKIGKSDDPERRLAQLQTAHYEELKILWVEYETPGPIKDEERQLHLSYEDDNIRGEWFKPENILRDLPGHQNMISVDIWEDGIKKTKDVIFRYGYDAVVRDREKLKPFGD